MTNEEIKAELRRSACEDFEPFWQINLYGNDWKSTMNNYRLLPKENVGRLSDEDCRTFFLLVAEAL